MLLVILSVLIVLLLAYANGANDNFKGVATLYGSGIASYRGALVWTTVATVAGSCAAILLGQGLLAAFSGKGLVPDAVAAMPTFSLAVVLGAATTVLLATKVGFPVSTTHALIGGLVGVGYLASPVGVDLTKLGSGFVIPLLVSPLLALVIAGGIHALVGRFPRPKGLTRESCVCIGTPQAPFALQSATGELLSSAAVFTPTIAVGADSAECDVRFSGQLVGVEVGTALDKLHYLSAGVVSFARALNDTPKIAAILLVSSVLSPSVGIGLVALFMAVGGLLHSRRVAETMSHRVTTMNHEQGLTANLVTGGMVILASKFGVPVSTTHIACGSLFGIGTVARTAQWRTITSIFLAWVTTLPASAILSGVMYFGIRWALSKAGG